MTAASRIPFRFSAEQHEYVDLTTGAVLPHITGLLKRAGLVDDLWLSDESAVRGTAIHKLTADYDLGALDPATCVSRHRNYLLAYVAAIKILRPEILAIEEPCVHPRWRFAGRPDRVAKITRKMGIIEIKSGMHTRAHQVQTALQAILIEEEYNLPAEMFERHCLYLKPTGKFVLEVQDSKRDFVEAQRILQEFCR